MVGISAGTHTTSAMGFTFGMPVEATRPGTTYLSRQGLMPGHRSIRRASAEKAAFP